VEEKTQVIDEERLREAAGGMEELEIDLLELLVADGRERLECLIAAIAAGDVGSARREAHTLKGASSSVGANPLSAIARTAEEVCVAGDLGAVQVDLLRTELERVNAYLESRR
jgi:HPt (histidine-containing phosphotransfer) domain-containing protein